ncbi:probable RNA-directed DNA polymerase from transposon BS [Penaeus vannamei]|uniref:probable RNA-directed DNA polymerase from transposon BS n=1 Tax=Penaeus vannamei TaxID=6689 RepID=UPI00387F5F28
MTEAERLLALSPRQPLNGQRVLRISGFAGRGEMPNSTQIQAVKVGSLNVGTMSGKGREVVDLMERRKLEQEKIPSEWRKSTIVPIYKQKGNIQDCTNYRGIKLISHTMKLWERTVGMRIEAETVISENQFGFVKGRQTSDAIFALRQTMEKC